MNALPDDAWIPHLQRHPGNDAVILVSKDGGINHYWDGDMLPTKWLECLPAVKQIMDCLPCDIERSRFMRIQPGYVMPMHIDSDPYWDDRVRIHVPIVTNDKVEFQCAEETRHMKVGECWIFDNKKPHGVVNGGNEARVHLVMDTLGSKELWHKAIPSH